MNHPLAGGLVAALCLTSSPSAQETPPVLTVGGESYATWDEYVRSNVFQAYGLRCGTPDLPPGAPEVPGDCSSTSTTIKPEYTPANGMVDLTVVVHVIENTAGQGKIPDALVQSQIDVLNEDFRALSGTNGAKGTDAGIRFSLASVDPEGNPTTGITRSVDNTWFADGGSYWNTLAWDPNRYVNIYTNNAGGALGYVPALPQGGIPGSKSDRVVILWSAFGRNAPIGPPYDQGRTATHEVGHYLGLYHTFQGGCAPVSECYQNGDRICDTNPESQPRFGCPASASSCSTSDPTDNYLDYTDDLCMERFTPEQVNRMRCTIENYRPHLSGASSGCSLAGTTAVRNGTGVNPLCLSTANQPVIGTTWQIQVDATVLPAATATIVRCQAPAAGHFYGFGELLLNLAAPTCFLSMAPASGLTTHEIAIPYNAELLGYASSIQGIVLASELAQACNAIDFVIGCSP